MRKFVIILNNIGGNDNEKVISTDKAPGAIGPYSQGIDLEISFSSLVKFL